LCPSEEFKDELEGISPTFKRSDSHFTSLSGNLINKLERRQQGASPTLDDMSLFTLDDQKTLSNVGSIRESVRGSIGGSRSCTP